MWRVARLLLVAVFAFLAVLTVQPAASASTGSDPVSASSGQQDVVQTTSAAPTDSAPSGPPLNPEQTNQRFRQKLVIGLVAAALLAIVILGRRSRSKRRKKITGAVTK